jgi:hypothetical protein
MTQTALDWRLEGFYARFVDAQGKCRAMIRVPSAVEMFGADQVPIADHIALPEVYSPGASRVKVP